MRTATITRDGRTICFHTTGRSDAGRCVVFVHPSPGSGAFDPDPDETIRRDVVLVGVDRPGYGRSDVDPEGDGSTAAAHDIAAVLDHLGFTAAGVAGWSTGGDVAADLAVRRPDLVDRLVLLGTPAPNDKIACALDDADPPRWLADVTDGAAYARLVAMLDHGRSRAGGGQKPDDQVAFEPEGIQAKTLLLYGTSDTEGRDRTQGGGRTGCPTRGSR